MRIIFISFIIIFVSGCFAQGTSTGRQEFLNEYASEAEWQPDKVIEILKIQEGWYIGDLGAGGGYYTYRFAEETGKDGKVFAADINDDFLENIKKAAAEKELKNVYTILSSEDDSNFDDKSLDLIFIRNTLHHIDSKNDYMKKLTGKLKEKGRIVVIDYKRDANLFSGHNVTRKDILESIKDTRLTIDQEYDFLEKQYFFILKQK